MAKGFANMSIWWLRIREILAGDGSVRDRLVRSRPTAKPGGSEASAPVPRDWRWPGGLGLLLLILHVFLFPPVPRLTTDFPTVGQIAEEEIRAPFTFVADLPDRDIQMRRLERVLVEPPALRVQMLNDGAGGHDRMDLWLEAVADQLADSTASMADRVGILSLQYPATDPDDLHRLLRSDDPDSLVARMARAHRQIMADGVVDMLPVGKYDRVVILTPQTESLREVRRLMTQSDLEDRLTAVLRDLGLGPVEAVEVASVMRHFIVPNLVYDSGETRLRQEIARQEEPSTREFINGERIIDRGVRVTEEHAAYLSQLEAILRNQGDGHEEGRLARLLVRVVVLSLILGLFGWMSWVHFPQEMTRIRYNIAQAIILSLFLLGADFALSRPGFGTLAVPIILLSLLSTVLYRYKVGYINTLLAIILLTVLPGVDAISILVWFALGMVTVISVRRIQKRSQFYKTITLLTALSVAMVFLLGMTHGQTAESLLLVGLFAPVLLVAFGLFILPVVEPLVGVCSDLTLLELSDLNHPLLQRMALEAQGTYHHSQVVGQLAEHAARAIDANALRTRVGALFHDIGKMQKPEYYVENQSRSSNKHDELSPSMSALVIAAHVKDGIELGRKWRLPQTVIDFIPEHHGTMVMEYFYHKAISDEGNAPVMVDDFRYPGPKPQSRETAILMLADAVEAATRSLPKPTPSRIREITKQIIDKRMLSGELDQSGVTLSDLAKIRESFIPLLTGIHHARIQYPGQGKRDVDSVPERKGDRKART